VKKATGPSAFRDALHLFNAHLARDADARATLTKIKEQRDRALPPGQVRQRFGLDPEELEYVEATEFRPLDAHYLAQAFELRDAARALQARDLPKLKQAELAFHWVMRQVALRERDDDLVPPQFVLQGGQGTARERACVFLALAHQLGIDGCMLAIPGEAPDRPHFWAAGVRIVDKGLGDVYLFDPRLGVPVPGPGGQGIATLAQLREQPELLQPFLADKETPYDVSPEQARKSEVYVVAPLSALAPRMKFLEDLLSTIDRIHLAVDPPKLLERFAAAARGEVRFCNQPSPKGGRPPSTPARALRLFLPAGEGGVDKADKAQRQAQQTVPLPAVFKAFRDLRLDEQLPRDARERHLRFALDLYARYAVTPHEHLLRGRLDEATKELLQARDVLHEFDVARLPEAEFLKQVAQWREQVKEAYHNVIVQEPGAQQALAKMWGQDQYLLALIHGDEEARKKLQKKVLSYIIVRSVEAPLRHDASYLLALCWQERAEREQTRRGARAADLAGNWLNVEDWWKKYAERYPYHPGTIKSLLAAVGEFWRARELELAVGYWERALAEVRAGFHGRLLRAAGLEKAGKAAKAREQLTHLAADLAALRQDAELKQALTETRGQTARVPSVDSRLRNLERDLGPGGSFAWMRAAALYRLRQMGN
jgi:hypothetical protein